MVTVNQTFQKRQIIFVALLIFAIGQVFALDKPNILWITIEDTSPQFIGCYGNENAKTPVIDKLAEEGIKFNNAFSTGTVCSPSRSTIITGVHTFKLGTGNHRSAIPLPKFIKGFPYYLKQQGYYVTNNNKTDYNISNLKPFMEETWDESSNKAGWWNREEGQPFFSVFNFADSHQSRTMTNPYEWYEKHVLSHLEENEIIGPNDFEMPPFYKDSPAMRKYFARVYNSIKLTDKKIGKLLERLDEDGLRDNTIVFFYADHGEGIPRGKTNGINLGYRVPYVIWVPEKYKHLSPWGTGGVETDELTNFNDLAPTVLALSGAEIPEHMTGRILMGEKRSQPVSYLELSTDRIGNGPDLVRTITNGEYVYSRNYMAYMPELRYIRYLEIADITKEMRKDLANGSLNTIQEDLFESRPAEVLYNIKNDLWEINNLAYDAKYENLISDFNAKLKKCILESKDVHFLPEYEIELMSEYTTPYEFRLDQERFPIDKIYEVTALSGIRTQENLEKQIRYLDDENEIRRYWAITGLLHYSYEQLHPYKEEILALLNDTYPPNVILASSILYEYWDIDIAMEMLKKYARDEDMRLAFMAINQMAYVTNKSPFVETVEEVVASKKANFSVRTAGLDLLGILNLVPNDFEHQH